MRIWHHTALAIPSLLLGAALGAAETAPPRPNVIIILCDDLGYGDVAPYGQTAMRTPALTRMAAEGMRFTDGYSAAPVCTPSRACLLTGRHAAASNIKDNGDEPRFPGSPVLGQTLTQAGYDCAVFGKWGLGGSPPSSAPAACGFTTFLGYHGNSAAHESFPPVLDSTAGPTPLPGNAAGARTTWAPAVYFEHLLRFIEQPRSGPFLALWTPTIPHPGHEVPAEELATRVPRFRDPKPFAGNNLYPANPTPNAAYATQIELLDRQVERLMALLSQRGLDRRTLVIFTSDNGPGGAGGADLAYLGSAGGLRGGKRSLWESGIRVPFLAWWPGTIAPASETARVVASYDIYPTVCAVAGAPVPGTVTGASFLPTLRGQAQAEAPAHGWEYRESQAVRAGKFKIVRAKSSESWQLFDLSTDRVEADDLAARMPEEVTRLAALAVTHGLLSRP